MDICNYKNILGKPNKGDHSYRIFNTLLYIYIYEINKKK